MKSNFQNDCKMGEILQQMLGFLLISSLLAYCDSFPQINDRNVRNTRKQDKFMIEDALAEIKKQDETKGKENEIVFDSSGNKQVTGAKLLNSNSLLKNSEKILRTVRGFTEQSIGNMLKYYIIKKRKQQKTSIDTIGVITGENTNVQMMQNSSTTDISVAKLPALATKYSDINKKATDDQSIDKIKMPAPAKSKVDRWLPGLRNYRRRRSFLSDMGFRLESAFEDDHTDVVFGAHTSPCDYADRHYCLNGGTCVFLGALEMKTCR